MFVRARPVPPGLARILGVIRPGEFLVRWKFGPDLDAAPAVWQVDNDSPVPLADVPADVSVVSALAVPGGSVVLGDDNDWTQVPAGCWVARYTESGKAVWTHVDAGYHFGTECHMAVGVGVVGVAGRDRFRVLDLATGAVRWEKPFPDGNHLVSTAVLPNDDVAFFQADPAVWRAELRTSTGEEVWTRTWPRPTAEGASLQALRLVALGAKVVVAGSVHCWLPPYADIGCAAVRLDDGAAVPVSEMRARGSMDCGGAWGVAPDGTGFGLMSPNLDSVSKVYLIHQAPDGAVLRRWEVGVGPVAAVAPWGSGWMWYAQGETRVAYGVLNPGNASNCAEPAACQDASTTCAGPTCSVLTCGEDTDCAWTSASCEATVWAVDAGCNYLTK